MKTTLLLLATFLGAALAFAQPLPLDLDRLDASSVSVAAAIVNDLKHGVAARGGVGLWVDVGTEGFLRDLKVSRE